MNSAITDTGLGLGECEWDLTSIFLTHTLTPSHPTHSFSHSSMVEVITTLESSSNYHAYQKLNFHHHK
jgi:hypothetical protein